MKENVVRISLITVLAFLIGLFLFTFDRHEVSNAEDFKDVRQCLDKKVDKSRYEHDDEKTQTQLNAIQTDIKTLLSRIPGQ